MMDSPVKIADQLERLNTNVEALVAELRLQRGAHEDGLSFAKLDP